MATFTPNFPPSKFLRAKADKNGDEPRRQTKEEYRKMKELEEGRKAGTVPAMTDIDTGKDINPHIPHYIANAPWYLGSEGPTLKHQRPHPERQVNLAEITDTYKKGLTTKIATKYRKGACENCGSMTHKKKDCFERPRKIGARFTGEDIAPDELVPEDLTQSYDAKRDRWSGFDPNDHKKVIDEYQRLEEARKMVKAEQLTKTDEKVEEVPEKPVEGVETPQDGTEKPQDGSEKPQEEPEKPAQEVEEEEDKDFVLDEDKYAEGADMPGVKVDVDSHTRITVRNLRIREDTAKYLYNLDPESAYYDPKSRAMRDNPLKGTGKGSDEVPFAGDNFKRYTGEVTDVNRIQLFAWEAHNRGVDVHVLAEPTKLEALKKEFETRSTLFKNSNQQAILDKYGGAEHLMDAPPKELLLAQTDTYVEYNRKGAVTKGVEKAPVKSKYEEDVYPNNHTQVWGSYWNGGKWGYKCCHGFVKNSYCTGEEGKEAQLAGFQAAARIEEEEKKKGSELSSSSSSDSSDTSSSEEESEGTKKKKEEEVRVKRAEQKRKRRIRAKDKMAAKKRKSGNDEKEESESSSSSSEEEEEEPEAKKLRLALIKQAREEREGERMREMDERARTYHSNYEVKQLDEYEIEAFKLRQLHSDDPMAKYVEKKRKT